MGWLTIVIILIVVVARIVQELRKGDNAFLD